MEHESSIDCARMYYFRIGFLAAIEGWFLTVNVNVYGGKRFLAAFKGGQFVSSIYSI